MSSEPSSQPSVKPSTSSAPSYQPSLITSTSSVPSSQPSQNPSISSYPSSEPSLAPTTSLSPTFLSDCLVNPFTGEVIFKEEACQGSGKPYCCAVNSGASEVSYGCKNTPSGCSAGPASSNTCIDSVQLNCAANNSTTPLCCKESNSGNFGCFGLADDRTEVCAVTNEDSPEPSRAPILAPQR